jgi:outer membrane protein TolC
MKPSHRSFNLRSTAAVLVVVFATPTFAQQPTAPSLGQPVRLSLGDAARRAASQSNSVQGAVQRAEEAQARVTQARSALYPDFRADALQSGRTFNSVTFGITIPPAPGQAPLFNPATGALGSCWSMTTPSCAWA